MLALENTKQNVMLYLSFERPCSQINATQRLCFFNDIACETFFWLAQQSDINSKKVLY